MIMNIMVSELIHPIPNYNQGLWLKLEGMWFRNKRKSDFTWWVVSSWNLLPQARVRLEMKIPSMLWKILLLTDCNRKRNEDALGYVSKICSRNSQTERKPGCSQSFPACPWKQSSQLGRT